MFALAVLLGRFDSAYDLPIACALGTLDLQTALRWYIWRAQRH